MKCLERERERERESVEFEEEDKRALKTIDHERRAHHGPW